MKLNIKTNILIDKSYKNLSEEINFKKFKKIVLIVDKKIYQFNYIK